MSAIVFDLANGSTLVVPAGTRWSTLGGADPIAATAEERALKLEDRARAIREMAVEVAAARPPVRR